MILDDIVATMARGLVEHVAGARHWRTLKASRHLDRPADAPALVRDPTHTGGDADRHRRGEALSPSRGASARTSTRRASPRPTRPRPRRRLRVDGRPSVSSGALWISRPDSAEVDGLPCCARTSSSTTYQVYEAAARGRGRPSCSSPPHLDDDELGPATANCRRLGLDALVESHDAARADAARAHGARDHRRQQPRPADTRRRPCRD